MFHSEQLVSSIRLNKKREKEQLISTIEVNISRERVSFPNNIVYYIVF